MTSEVHNYVITALPWPFDIDKACFTITCHRHIWTAPLAGMVTNDCDYWLSFHNQVQVQGNVDQFFPSKASAVHLTVAMFQSPSILSYRYRKSDTFKEKYRIGIVSVSKFHY